MTCFEYSSVAYLIILSGLLSISKAVAWLPSSALDSTIAMRLRKHPIFRASQSSSSFDEEGSSLSLPTSNQQIQRLSPYGVSVSPDGFWLVLENPLQRENNNAYYPVQVTSDPQDEFAATSAESLTLIQLLSGVDMAGAILPPDALARMVVHYCEEEDEEEENKSVRGDDDLKDQIKKFVKVTLPSSEPSYSEAHPWYRSKVRLPTVSLNELKIEFASSATFSLECTIKGFGRISFTPSSDVLGEVCYNYSPKASLEFMSLALALRYKAPVVLHDSPESSRDDHFLSLEQIKERFPMFATADKLRQSSTRVHQNIERGFEVHKLSGALKIAMERDDQEAVKKIRAKLDEYDSLDELPTLPTQDLTDKDALQ